MDATDLEFDPDHYRRNQKSRFRRKVRGNGSVHAKKIRGGSMHGNMMQMPLLISALLRHADAYHGDTEIVSRLAPGEIHRYTYRDAHRRTRRLANALGSLGVVQSSRVGTLACNTHRHF